MSRTFEILPTDSESEINQKESMKSWFNPERYTIELKYHSDDMMNLLDSEKMEKFINDAKTGKLPLHTRSCAIPEPQGLTKNINGD